MIRWGRRIYAGPDSHERRKLTDGQIHRQTPAAPCRHPDRRQFPDVFADVSLARRRGDEKAQRPGRGRLGGDH